MDEDSFRDKMKIPSWQSCQDKIINGGDELDPIERFIHEHEPLHKFDARLWRQGLLELLNYKLKFCLDDTFTETVDYEEARSNVEDSNLDAGRMDADEASGKDFPQLELMGLYPFESVRKIYHPTPEWVVESTD